MRIAHISDTHLGCRQYNLDERENDFYDAFNEAIERVIEERADVLIHSGDLFDSPTPPIKALYIFKNILDRLEDKMKILTVLGEHDIPKRKGMIPHRLFDIPVLGIGKLEWIELNGMLIAGISNLKGRLVDLLKQELAKFDAMAEKYRHSILIAHQAIERYLPFEGAYELKEDDLPRKASYYALGHIHSRLVERFGEGWLAYSGSTEIRRRYEISAWEKKGKGFYIVDFDGDEAEIQPINLDIRPQLDLEIEAGKIEELANYTNYQKKPVLHLRIYGKSINRQHVIEKLNQILKDRVLTYRYSFVEGDLKQMEIPKGSIDIKAVFKEYLEDEKLAELAMELYELLSDEDLNGAIKAAGRYLELGG